MAKGSVRKKGKKWYYRFYVEDESGNRIQKEFPGTESKSETEALLRKAMENYESTQFIAKAKNVTLASLLDLWLEEEVKPSHRSNGTVRGYQNTVDCIKKHSLSNRKLQSINPEHLQKYFDELGASISYMRMYGYAAVFRGAFRFAVFPKQFITFNPMQYVNLRAQKENCDLFQSEDQSKFTILTTEQYNQITAKLKAKGSAALLPIQIAYYSGLRLGEVCALTWQDIDLEAQCMTIRRSMSYDQHRKAMEIGPTKRNKVRTVDFGETLTEILKAVFEEQKNNRKKYDEYYKQNYCISVKDNNRVHYVLNAVNQCDELPEGHIPFDLVCTRADGRFIRPEFVERNCRRLAKEFEGLEGFHFHTLRHTYTSNLLSKGAAPKDVQELLGHSDVNMTLNVYAHSARESKRNSAKLLDTLDAI
ncbi:MAG: site-specific integrase [Oscillospiraceae bacterium]|nr:site-specific integrase [Oscillospiraceae bacterium]